MQEAPENLPTLKDAGIDWKLSSGAQKLAAIPEAPRAGIPRRRAGIVTTLPCRKRWAPKPGFTVQTVTEP